MRDYPRTSGGTGAARRRAESPYGLSPHERGNQPREEHGEEGVGTIPARAGEPRLAFLYSGIYQDYPRTSGGTRPPPACRRGGWGLSPHERGNRYRSHHREPANRTIPARAGEPTAEGFLWGLWEDYPRTSGGTTRPGALWATMTGLSPHERGNRWRITGQNLRTGTIPARAGEPEVRAVRRHRHEDYPRTSGGTQGPSRSRPILRGLSPHERGNPLHRNRHVR